jgi:hypothetical protein
MPNWPVGTKSKGNEGVTASIMTTAGSIGYVEFGYARSQKFRWPCSRTTDYWCRAGNELLDRAARPAYTVGDASATRTATRHRRWLFLPRRHAGSRKSLSCSSGAVANAIDDTGQRRSPA